MFQIVMVQFYSSFICIYISVMYISYLLCTKIFISILHEEITYNIKCYISRIVINYRYFIYKYKSHLYIHIDIVRD